MTAKSYPRKRRKQEHPPLQEVRGSNQEWQCYSYPFTITGRVTCPQQGQRQRQQVDVLPRIQNHLIPKTTTNSQVHTDKAMEHHRKKQTKEQKEYKEDAQIVQGQWEYNEDTLLAHIGLQSSQSSTSPYNFPPKEPMKGPDKTSGVLVAAVSNNPIILSAPPGITITIHKVAENKGY